MSNLCLMLCSIFFAVYITAASEHSLAKQGDDRVPSLGEITGVVNRIKGDSIVPVSGAKLFFSSIGSPQRESESVTNKDGKYVAKLPSGSYHEWVEWFGDCPKIRRAGFDLAPAEHFKFDFIVVACPIVDTERIEVPFQGSGSRDASSLPPEPEGRMDVPLAKQRGGYQEQLFPANSGQWPEIIISFGKYDNEPSRTTYFSLTNQIVKNLSPRPTIVPRPLPVTITVDRYTLRASDVVLTKKAMTFELRGEVSISDGVYTQQGSSATLSFPGGKPKVELSE